MKLNHCLFCNDKFLTLNNLFIECENIICKLYDTNYQHTTDDDIVDISLKLKFNNKTYFAIQELIPPNDLYIIEMMSSIEVFRFSNEKILSPKEILDKLSTILLFS